MLRRMVCVLAALGCVASAFAQTPPAPQRPPASNSPSATSPNASQPAQSADPAQTTASYGDWVLRCVRTGDKSAGPRVCEVVQTMVLQGQQQPVAQVALGYDKNELRMTLLLPPAISFSRTPTLSVPGSAGPHFDLAWRRCLPNGCFADIQVGADLLKLLRSRSEPMQITFKDAGERDGSLPFSMRGLVPALDALAKEPR